GLVATVGIDHEQPHVRVRRAGGRIALLVRPRAGGADRGAGDHADRRLVHARDGDAAIIGAPPVPGPSAHFLLRHEFRLAPGDQLARFLWRARRWLLAQPPDP